MTETDEGASASNLSICIQLVSSYLSTLGSPLSLRVSLFSCERVVESSLVSDLQEAFNGQTYPIDFTQCQVAFGSTCFVQFDLFQSISLIGKKSIRLSKAYFLSNNSNIQLPIDLLFNSQTRDFDALSNQQELSLHNSVIKLNMSFSPSILTVLDSLVTDLNSSETYEPRKSSSSTLPSTDDGIINSKTSSSIKESIVFKNPPINQNDLAFSVSPYILKSCLLPGDLNPDVKVVAEDHPNDIVKSNLQSLVMNFNVGLVLDLEQKILVSSNINWLRCIEGSIILIIMSVNFSDSTKVIEFIFLLKNWVAISPLTAMLLISYVCNSDNLDVFRESSAFTALWQSLIAPALLSKADGIEIDFALLHYPQILTLFFIVSGSQSNVHNLVLDLLIDWSTRWEVVGKQIFWTITSSICLKDILETTEEESLSSTLDIKTSSTELLIKFTQKFPEFLGHVHFWQRLTGILGQKSLKSLGRTQKINVIRTTIKNDLLRFPPISVIPHSDERVVGIIPSDMKVYKSSAQPILIPFIVRDSLRISESILKMEPVLNDAFSVQFLRLLDYIWRLDGLDLSLFIFGVTPLGSGHGIIECIPGARAISEVTFDKQKLADSTWMMRFISSCAGFTMFTYILGVGDRHTDNILLAPDGKIVHVDYAFILGADPKPFMPSVKISPQLMHVMSTGVSVCDAGNIAFFRRLVQDAFLTIRRNAGLLFAFIPGLPILDKLFSSDQLIRYTTERLFLDGSTDELVALNQLMRLLEESIGSIVPAITDRLHTWVQYWRQ